ncbi:hypothetical protein V2G26_016574 [Clonostachys chloroleuca]
MSTVTGSCVCGAVKYSADISSSVKAVCHCLNCQRRTASAFSVNIIISEELFRITQGTTKKSCYIADSQKPYNTHFCGHCGSTLYGKPEAFPGTISIKAGSLDEPFTNLGSINAEAFTKRRRDYIQPLEGVKQVEGMISP